MASFADSSLEAIDVLFSGNTEFLSAIYVSLSTACMALVLSSFCAIPLAIYIAFKHSYITSILHFILDTLLAIPTVLLGLIGYLLFSQQGPFASFHILYTLSAIGIMLAVLAFPILSSLLISAIERTEKSARYTVLTLGASQFQMLRAVFWENRNAVAIAYITTLTRVISEVGIAMIVGGNIRYHTRTITTTIALETGKGNFSLGLALGIVLLCMAIVLNTSIRILQKRVYR